MALTIPGFDPVPGEHILLVGSRDLESDEIALLNRVGVTRVTGTEDQGSQVALLAHQVDWVYLHFDLDVLDPSEAIANQWTASGGLTIAAIKHVVESIQRNTRIKGFGIASYDPELDRDGRALGAALSVAELLLGATI
jgi:arginase